MLNLLILVWGKVRGPCFFDSFGCGVTCSGFQVCGVVVDSVLCCLEVALGGWRFGLLLNLYEIVMILWLLRMSGSYN